MNVIPSSLQPRCPNCQGGLSFTHNKIITFLSCNGKCKETFELHSAEDMVKFFASAHEPTLPEGEAVPDLILQGHEPGCPHLDYRQCNCTSAPVVSTAAPVAKKPKREPTQCANCKNKIIPFGDYLWTHAATCNMMCNLAAKPLAPESYKPAEGPKWNEILLKFREYRLWMHEQVNWLANKWQQRGDVECREEMLALLRIEPDADTSVYKCRCGEENNFQCRVCGVAWPEEKQ